MRLWLFPILLAAAIFNSTSATEQPSRRLKAKKPYKFMKTPVFGLPLRPDESNAIAHRYLNTLIKTPAMSAGQKEQFSASFVVPAAMPPGKYNVEDWSGINGWDAVFDQQINMLTITK